jgi:glycosyltransferase involved in cell wall biosynthesis
VLHLITGLDTGGAELALARVAAGLARRGVGSRVVSMTEAGPVASRLAAARVPVVTLGMRPGWADPRAVARLRAQLASVRPDVIQTWMYHADLLGTIARGPSRQPLLVWSVRASNVDMEHYGVLSGLTRRACAWLSGRPDAVISNSRVGAEFHARIGYRPRRWEIVPNGVDAEVFKPDAASRAALRRELSIAADAQVVGLVARLDPMKGHAIFLEAARSMLRANDRLWILLAGTGVRADAEPFRSWLPALDAGARERVRLLGRRDDIASVHAALDVACSASTFGEGFPNAIAEAMACGVPVVATDVGDAADVVGEHGAIVAPGDAAALAAGCLALVADETRRRECGLGGRRRIVERFDLEQMVDRHDRLYRSLIGPAIGEAAAAPAGGSG